MSITPTEKSPVNDLRPGAPPAIAPAAFDFEERVRVFWEKNRSFIYIFCGAIVLAILARGAWEWMASRRQAAIQSAYAAAIAPQQLRLFVRNHSGHPLAGAAYLRLADQAYVAGLNSEALGDYEKAAAILQDTPLASRAVLGKAVCLILSGRNADGAAILEKLADDATELRTTRCEAAYHLATLALAAGSYDEGARRADQVMQLDPQGLSGQRDSWAQRALLLRARIPVAAVPASPAEKVDDGAIPSIKLPGS